MNFYSLSDLRKLDSIWKSRNAEVALKTVLNARKMNKGRNVRRELLDCSKSSGLSALNMIEYVTE